MLLFLQYSQYHAGVCRISSYLLLGLKRTNQCLWERFSGAIDVPVPQYWMSHGFNESPSFDMGPMSLMRYITPHLTSHGNCDLSWPRSWAQFDELNWIWELQRLKFWFSAACGPGVELHGQGWVLVVDPHALKRRTKTVPRRSVFCFQLENSNCRVMLLVCLERHVSAISKWIESLSCQMWLEDTREKPVKSSQFSMSSFLTSSLHDHVTYTPMCFDQGYVSIV